MIKVENIDVWGFEHAVRGMRNPMNSWDKSDSFICRKDDDAICPDHCIYFFNCKVCGEKDIFVVGKNDLDLMRRLYKAGSEHRKYLRQICVSMDITAPLYWWKEFDTYKVGTTANSCSTMHKIHAKEFTLDDFSHEHLAEVTVSHNIVMNGPKAERIKEETGTESPVALCDVKPIEVLQLIIDALNAYRGLYLETNNKIWWWQMIQLLPSSYNQRRTVTMNYENVVNMIHQRTGHKLDEWNNFVEILKGLPYVKEIIEE